MSLSCDQKCSTSNISHFTRVKWADDLNRINAYIAHAIPFHCDDMRIKNERTKKYGEGCQAIHLITRTYAEMMTCRMAWCMRAFTVAVKKLKLCVLLIVSSSFTWRNDGRKSEL